MSKLEPIAEIRKKHYFKLNVESSGIVELIGVAIFPYAAEKQHHTL